MQNYVNSNISWYDGHTITILGKILKFSKFYVQNIWQVYSEVMTIIINSLICIFLSTGQEMFCENLRNFKVS